MGCKAEYEKFRNEELSIVHADARDESRKCARSRMLCAFCPCSECRASRRTHHGDHCSCYLCFSDRMGEFIDELGRRTAASRWLWFVTLTFRTPHYPWMRGFPIEQPQPSPDFVHHFFDRMIHWIEGQVHHRVEYFTADQFGEMGGRIHLHCGLSWPGLFEYRWKDLQQMLWKDAGFNRILPWQMDAAFYIGRYIGRDAHRVHWDFRAGPESPSSQLKPPVGRKVLASSNAPDERSSDAYRQGLRTWHR